MPFQPDISSARKLELSRLNTNALQREAMGTDIDVDTFALYLSSRVRTNVVGSIVAGEISRTIEGASTLSVTLNDYDQKLLTSGLLSSKLDVQLDGLWFRLAAVDLNDDEITLTFEDREIAILRDYVKWKIARRSKTTRAEFVMNMIREVREFKIPVYIPELHKVQPVEKYPGDIAGVEASYTKGKGIPTDVNSSQTAEFAPSWQQRVAGATTGSAAPQPVVVLTVKGAPATVEQITNANIALGVCEEVLAGNQHKRKIMVATIMTAITESTIHNLTGGDADSVGLYQQRASWGSFEERHSVATATRMFLHKAIDADAADPTRPYWDLCATVQNPREDLRQEYDKWRTEANRFVSAFGVVGTDSETSAASANNVNTNLPVSSGVQGGNTDFMFWRGKIEDKRGQPIRKPENTWSCIQRLADEVDWRAFFVSGTFYFISEDDLFKQKPILTFQRFMPGIIGISGTYDRSKKSGSITITAEAGRWVAPPGSVIFVKDLGPYDGRWLVNQFSRSLFDDTATITLKKPRPALPEPISNNAASIQSTWYDQPTAASVPGGSSTQLRSQVLTNPLITFSNASERQDIQNGAIADEVLQFLLWLVSQGYNADISALKSDHSQYTSEGRLSAHGAGRAVDLKNFNSGNLPLTQIVMRLIAQNQVILGFDQMIGPDPSLVIPLGIYDEKTLNEHKSHIHVGWHL